MANRINPDQTVSSGAGFTLFHHADLSAYLAQYSIISRSGSRISGKGFIHI